jgi:hypothetical protein
MESTDLENLLEKYEKGLQIIETNYKRIEEKDR